MNSLNVMVIVFKYPEKIEPPMLNEAKLEHTSQRVKKCMFYASLSKKLLSVLLTLFIVYGVLIGLGFVGFNIVLGLLLSMVYVITFIVTHYMNHCVSKLLLAQERILYG